ncbi:hypothetical protein D3C80_1898700 [compost metagenome]
MFFLAHMAFQFLLHGLQMLGQAIGALAMCAVDLLYAPRLVNQLGQLFTVTLVVAPEDMRDQFGCGRSAPVVCLAHQGSLVGITQLPEAIAASVPFLTD